MLELDLVDMLAAESKNDYLQKQNTPSVVEVYSEPEPTVTSGKPIVPKESIVVKNSDLPKSANFNLPKMNVNNNISINWTPEGLSLFLPVQSNGAAPVKNTFSESSTQTTVQPESNQNTVLTKRIEDLESQLAKMTDLLQNLSNKFTVTNPETEVDTEPEIEEDPVVEVQQESVEAEKKSEEVEEVNVEVENQEDSQEFKLLKVADFDLYAESFEHAKETFDYLDEKQMKVAALALYQAAYRRRHGTLDGAYN